MHSKGLEICYNLKSGADIHKRSFYRALKFPFHSPITMCDGIFTGEGEKVGSTLTLCSTGTCEDPYLILNSRILISLSKASAKFQRDLKLYGPKSSLVRI